KTLPSNFTIILFVSFSSLKFKMTPSSPSTNKLLYILGGRPFTGIHFFHRSVIKFYSHYNQIKLLQKGTGAIYHVQQLLLIIKDLPFQDKMTNGCRPYSRRLI